MISNAANYIIDDDNDDEQISCLDDDWIYYDDIAESYSLAPKMNQAICSAPKCQSYNKNKNEEHQKKQKKRNGRKPFNRW